MGYIERMSLKELWWIESSRERTNLYRRISKFDPLVYGYLPKYGYRPLMLSRLTKTPECTIAGGLSRCDSQPDRDVTGPIIHSRFPNIERHIHEQPTRRFRNVNLPLCLSRTKGPTRRLVCQEERTGIPSETFSCTLVALLP